MLCDVIKLYAHKLLFINELRNTLKKPGCLIATLSGIETYNFRDVFRGFCRKGDKDRLIFKPVAYFRNEIPGQIAGAMVSGGSCSINLWSTGGTVANLGERLGGFRISEVSSGARAHF